MGTLESKEQKLDEAEERLGEKEEALREKARVRGRQMARHALRKIDTVFMPRNLNADDAKVIFHPVDYLVFNGMKAKGTVQDLLFIDRKAVTAEHRKIQQSIEKVVEKGRYEWQTLRVDEDGAIKAE
jgi:predicted Holliday junction resolvase-like endonuclease